MRTVNKNFILSSYSFSHAVVDFVCAASVFGCYINGVDTSFFFYLILIYNCLAFGLQSIFGIIADHFHFSKSLAILGCISLFGGPLFYFFNIPFLAVIFLGIGNALFHVGGGITTLAINPGKSKYPGIFVAPGAIGLFLGVFFGNSGYYSGIESIILLVMSILSMWFSSRNFHPYQLINNYSKENSKRDWKLPLLLIISLLLISIVIRSFIGFLINFSWKEGFLLSFIFVIFIAFGKALGGILADRFGWLRIGVSSLILSLPCLLLGEYGMFFGMLGIFLFNITMPIAFSAMIKAVPEKSGTMFGLLCLALLIGALPKLLNIDYMGKETILLIYLILLSAFVLYVALRALNIKK